MATTGRGPASPVSPASPATGIDRAVITTGVLRGAVAGVVGSLVMATYAMVASWSYQQHGFFTPLYHIASVGRRGVR
jgi:hypothetical protein